MHALSMRTTRMKLVALCAALLIIIAPHLQAQTSTPPGAEGTARVIVKFKADSPLLRAQVLSATTAQVSRAQALGARLGLTLSSGAAISEHAQVVFASGVSSEELAQRLAQQDDVEYAVPDGRKRHFVAPNDPLYTNGVGGNGPAVGQWYLRAPSGAVQSSLNVETAWAITTGSPSVVVAMLDTGVRFDHPDLLAVAAGGNLLPGYDMISDVNTGNNGQGRNPDASDPGDWVTQAEASKVGGPFYQCPVEGSSWHGTQTAGLVAALTNNGLGMASVGRNVRVLPVRVLGKCGGDDSDIIAGMLWAAGLSVPGVPASPNRAQVINMSLGGDGPCTAPYQDAVNQIIAAGTVIVVAAGNSNNAVSAPGNCAGVIAVGALRHVGTKGGYSSLGPEVAISAPGGNCVNTAPASPCLYPILSTWNSGTTTPQSSIYTDSYHYFYGTSFSAPLVAGTAALMLSAQPALTPYQVRVLLQSTARPFPTTGADTSSGPVAQCTAPQSDSFGNPIEQFECYCTTDTCGAGLVDAGAAVTAASAGQAAAGVQAGGLWWAAPAASESGWGINFANQGSTIFATWFTYDTTGKAWWLSMTANKTSSNPDTYGGQLTATQGPPFSAVPFGPVTYATVGSAMLTFSDLNRGNFNYVVNGTAQSKAITRQTFGPPPSCVYGPSPDFTSATNYQDLWWNAPANSEPGWGINLTHQGNNIFATWFTYDVDGTPLWLSVTAAKTATGVYSGQLFRTTGPPFNAVPFSPARVTRTVVGTATFTFANGNAATFAYTVNNVTQTKQITRELFAPPAGTLCH
jgi:serine protease